jgi:hypothetical protein
MKSVSRLEDGRHCLELSLVHGGGEVSNICHSLHPGRGTLVL